MAWFFLVLAIVLGVMAVWTLCSNLIRARRRYVQAILAIEASQARRARLERRLEGPVPYDDEGLTAGEIAAKYRRYLE